jgi:hypothetical protein
MQILQLGRNGVLGRICETFGHILNNALAVDGVEERLSNLDVLYRPSRDVKIDNGSLWRVVDDLDHFDLAVL